MILSTRVSRTADRDGDTIVWIYDTVDDNFGNEKIIAKYVKES